MKPIKGYEHLYAVDEWCTQSENILHCSRLGRHKTPEYRINGRFAKRGDLIG